MFLIGQSVITSYTKKHPEAAASLLIWFYNYIDRKRHFASPSEKWLNGSGTASEGNYAIEMVSNHTVKADLITWVGTIAEHEKREERKIARMLKYYEVRGIELETFTYTATVKFEDSENHIMDFDDSPTMMANVADKLACLNLDISLANLVYFNTMEEYEVGLKCATKLFRSRPHRANFIELCTLLLKIDQYEKTELHWPNIESSEFVKARLPLFQMTYTDFRDIFNTEDEFELFLSGQLKLKDEVLEKVYTRVGLKSLLKKA